MIGHTVNIGRGEKVRIRDLAEKIYRRLGKSNIKPIFEKERPGDIKRHFAGFRRLKGFLDSGQKLESMKDLICL